MNLKIILKADYRLGRAFDGRFDTFLIALLTELWRMLMSRNAALALENWETDTYSGSLFEPDVLLPSQFLNKDEEGFVGGERKLMAAILSDGIESYLQQAEFYIKGVSSRIDAIEWVETKDLGYVFSFDNVCTSLGINPEYLRIGLARYIQAIKAGNAVSDNSSEGKQTKPKWKKIRRPRKR